MDERRQLPRWEVNKETRMWIQQAQAFNHCMIEDLHLKGMRVSSERKLFHNQIVSLSFALGEGFDLIKIEAQIPWFKEEAGRFVYGLSFNKVADPDKDKIYQFISLNCSDQFKTKWWGLAK